MTKRSQVAGVGLAIALAAAAQSACPAQEQQACNCPPPKLVPITGHVLDAVTGKPIAGAVVHYFDSNPPLNIKTGERIRQPIVGEVKTAADGSYALPSDLPLSSFHVRASAPGYFSAGFRDEPAIVGQKWPADFPPRPSHDLRLEPNHDLVAIGSSLFPTTTGPLDNVEITATALSRNSPSIMIALRGPKLFVITWPEVHVTAIALPEKVTNEQAEIRELGWDGTRFIFTTGNETAPFVGGASAPDFHVTTLPAPDIFSSRVGIGNPSYSAGRFVAEEVSGCDDDSSPHCGQGGTLVVHDTSTQKTIPIESGPVYDLSYLLDQNFSTIVFSDPEEVRAERKVPVQIDPSGKIVIRGEKARLTLLHLVTGERTHIELPGDGSRTLTLLAQQPVSVEGAGVNAMRVAYSTEGDCDPQSTDAAQPFAPSGLAGDTPNAWSVCLVTIPFPPPPAARPADAKAHTSAQR